MPAGTYIITDPKLIRNASGTFHLQKGSPAINAAKKNYPNISVDIDGQVRKSKLDTGADEFSNETVKAKILNPSDAGARR